MCGSSGRYAATTIEVSNARNELMKITSCNISVKMLHDYLETQCRKRVKGTAMRKRRCDNTFRYM